MPICANFVAIAEAIGSRRNAHGICKGYPLSLLLVVLGFLSNGNLVHTRAPLPGEKICRMAAPTLNQITTFTSFPFKLLLLALEIPELIPQHVPDCFVSFFSHNRFGHNPILIAADHLVQLFTNPEQITSQNLSKLSLPIKAATGIPWKPFSRCGSTTRTV